jgi:hypothetical protein
LNFQIKNETIVGDVFWAANITAITAIKRAKKRKICMVNSFFKLLV